MSENARKQWRVEDRVTIATHPGRPFYLMEEQVPRRGDIPGRWSVFAEDGSLRLDNIGDYEFTEAPEA